MATWEALGEVATVVQLSGLDAGKLISMIVKAANTARMHKKNCRQFALHLKLIGNLLEQLRISELKKYPETREPLEQLEDALRRSYVLVNSCQDRSYLYLLAMGWNIVYQFRKAQNEIDRYLKLVPLITLVDNARVRIGPRNLDCQWQTCLENTSSVSSGHDLLSTRGSYRHEEWHTDLLGCCSEPCLCIKTFFFPCGTFSKIATVANNRHISPAESCNELMAYSLVLSCCCYTCYIRRKLRKMLNITGGFVDDFLSHLMCCCCALVQEWREVEIRGVHGPEKTKISPPPSQYMES
ncbi:protein mid1-complementing activity 1 [Quercus suber]|uniref:Protein mid1-complementing activity 1 n=1 Tax=Quercus suber TaxID=58331 RepID=A0AAW0J181_QUESU